LIWPGKPAQFLAGASHADTTTLSIHRIVQAVLKDQLSQEQQRQWAIAQYAWYTSSQMSISAIGASAFKYLTQAQLCAEYISNFHLTLDEAAQLLHRLGATVMNVAIR